ncbi:uncharacterized protein [Antedon mediterranea]|uniref:uncharacterized protein n=1 Tax=Antedon mediterranea TaxID=105859 RepID=UPI003AF9F72A
MADQVRVILWCIPRTVSTAFSKCMSYLDNAQVINEPYLSAYSVGPERFPPSKGLEKDADMFINKSNAVASEYGGGFEADVATYKYVKENILEAEYPGKNVVFVKDMSHSITWKLHMLPKGYRHAFLIRNPVKVFPSWKKMLNNFQKALSSEFRLENNNNNVPKRYGFGESLELYEHLIKTGIEPDPIIIDSDDLLENPEMILREFCKRTGIQYDDKLLNWDTGEGVLQKWKANNVYLKGHKVFGYYDKVLASERFHKPEPSADRAELSEDVNTCIDAALPYYEKLYALRLCGET